MAAQRTFVSVEAKPVPLMVTVVVGKVPVAGEPVAGETVIAGSEWNAALGPEVSPWLGVICKVYDTSLGAVPATMNEASSRVPSFFITQNCDRIRTGVRGFEDREHPPASAPGFVPPNGLGGPATVMKSNALP